MRGRLAILPFVASAWSCAEGFDAHEPFESESYLCGTVEWDDLVADCRDDYSDDGSCQGVISFEGTLQGQRVVVAARLDESDLGDVLRLDASRDRRDIAVVGSSPYFEFELQIDYIGGDVDLGPLVRNFTIAAPLDPDAPLDDDRVEGALRIASGLSSRDQNFRSGNVVIIDQAADSMTGSFSATTFGNDTLEGCFVALDADPSVETETP